ncbi:hypothetical protein Tco_0687516 [Tanacetum coccineum]
MSLDWLPHRLNLSARGIGIPTISCPSCNGNVESADHIFFEYDLVKELHFGGCRDIITASLFVLSRCGKVISLVIFALLLILAFLIGDA